MALILLKRAVRRQSRPPDTFAVTTWYHNTVTYGDEEETTTADVFDNPQSFSADPAVSQGWYCRGSSRFDVYHRAERDGRSRVVETPNFPACATVTDPPPAPTTDPLRLQADITPAGVNGRGSATIVPLNGVGSLVYAREGSGLEPTASNVFTDLPVGRYWFRGTETRTGGRTALIRVTIHATYGPRYRLRFRDKRGRCNELLFEGRGYSGPIEDLLGTPDALSIDWPGGSLDHVFTTPLRGSECEMTLLLTYAEQMLGVFSGDERLYRITYTINEQRFWRGFLLPEQYTVAHLPGLREFNLAATDGLGALDGVPFTGPLGEPLRGDWTLLEIVQNCLSRLDLDLPLCVRWLLYPAGADTTRCALEQVRYDVQQYSEGPGKPWSCGKVLQSILKLNARLLQQDGVWWLERLADLTTGEMSYFVYDQLDAPNGTLPRTLLKSVTGPNAPTPRLYYQNAEQQQGLRGAVRSVTINAAPGELANLLANEVFLDPEKVTTTGLPKGWLGSAPATILPGAKRRESGTLLLPGASVLTAPEAAAFVQTPASAPVPAFSPLALPMQLRFTVTVRSDQAMPAEEINKPRLFVGLRHGNQWLGGGDGGTPGTQRLSPVRLMALNQAQTVELGGYGRQAGGDTTSAEIILRFLQVVAPASHAPYHVEISNIELTWQILSEVDKYADITTQEGQALFTRTDNEEELYHTDTPNVRYQGSLLTATQLPTSTWFEVARPSQLLPLHAYVVNDRFQWQQNPAQVLTGLLRGVLGGPCTLLTDPFERRPAVYLLTSVRYHAVQTSWKITAVQNALLVPPMIVVPEGAILNENETAWLSEARQVMLYENAPSN